MHAKLTKAIEIVNRATTQRDRDLLACAFVDFFWMQTDYFILTNIEIDEFFRKCGCSQQFVDDMRHARNKSRGCAQNS